MVTFLDDVEFVSKSAARRKRSKVARSASDQRSNKKLTMDDRAFIAWDGEGWTQHVCEEPEHCLNRSGKCKHHYYLFGASTGQYISAESLSTEQCFDVMLRVKKEHPDAIHVAFSFKYDIDMIFRDLQPGAVRMLVRKNRMHWRGYYIEVLPGKWLQVTKDGYTCRIYDLFSFFATSFVKALRIWNVGTSEELAHIERGKSLRGNFTLESLESDVIPYWKSELRLLALLAESLRDILYSAGIRPARWHGPGAVADFLFRGNKSQLHMPEYDQLPKGVLDAGQYAYAGGRFEAFKIGYYDGPIYSADINSAYPYAMSELPDMATGAWIYHSGMPSSSALAITTVGMFHVRYVYGPEAKRAIAYGGMPAATHYRYPKSGTVHFRYSNPGVWVHAPEFRNLLVQYELGMFESFDVLESWIYADDGTRPFAWVRDIYDQRQDWKKQGNPAQLAAKLGINSLYGKLAQRVGGKEGKPKWHNLEMAGHITSKCRAMLYEASWQMSDSLVAYQTDGIYATRPIEFLPNGAGTDLGQWEVETYSGMLHLQSGVYWLRDKDGNWLRPKTRGIPQQHMDFGKAYDSLVNKVPLIVEQTQFIRFGLADMRRSGLSLWRTWQINEKDFSFGGNGFGSEGKRLHISQSCKECAQGIGHHEGLHTLMLSPKGFPMKNGVKQESAPHYLPWRKLGQLIQNVEDAATLNRWGEINDA